MLVPAAVALTILLFVAAHGDALSGPPSAPEDRRAYIGREPGGLGFSGYVVHASSEEKVLEKGGPWSDVETAVSWGRERASQVLLTYGVKGDSVFSAGIAYYEGPPGGNKPLPTWPPSKETREALDEDVAAALQHETLREGSLGVESPEQR